MITNLFNCNTFVFLNLQSYTKIVNERDQRYVRVTYVFNNYRIVFPGMSFQYLDVRENLELRVIIYLCVIVM